MLENQLTIKDIANLSNVSTTTISRYINGKYEYMSEGTRLHIQDVIEKVGYHPNAMARSLKSRQSRMVGIISTDMYVPEISAILSGFCNALTENGYTPMIYNTNNNIRMEKECIRACAEQADGLIMRPTHKDLSVYHVLHSRGLPIVLYDRYIPAWQYDAVYIDHYGVVTQAMEHLHQQGFACVYYATDTTNPMNTKMFRRQAFLDYTARYYGRSGEPYIHIMDPKGAPDQERRMIQSILQDPINGRKALFYDGAGSMKPILKALQDERVKIPNELGVCGYDFNGWSELMDPAISSIVSPAYEMAYKAASLLACRLEKKRQHGDTDEPVSYEKVVLQAKFIPRASTKIL